MLEQVPRILSFIHQRSDEDSVNRLVSFYSVVILSLSVLLVSAKQYVGSPLQCWVPAHFTGAMEQYTENYCWIENTWYYPIKSKLPWLPQTREDAKISYYQWVPFLLLLQCFFCFLPPRFWAFVNGCSGHDPKSVMKSARACRSLTDGSAHNTTISQIAEHLYKPRDVRLDTISSALRRNFNRYSILVAYILSKCFYFIVILLQFWAMMRFLDINNPFFGYKMYEDLVNNINWEQTGIFPRVTMCDFEVKVMGNLHRYTVQCVLLINMFNEKIFMLLWFWFAVLIFVFAGSICYWCAFMIDRFVDNFLGPDVVFLLVLLKGHGGNIILSEVLLELWKKYKSVPSLMQNGSHKVKIYPDKSSKKSHKEKPSVFVSRHNHRNDADERGNEFVENGLYKRPERLNLKLLDELAAVDENPEDQQQNDDVGYKVNYPPIPPPYARAQRNDNH